MACLQHFNHKEQVWIDVVWWKWQVDDDYDINVTLNQNDKYGIEMTIWGGLGKGSRPHGIEIQYYWKTYLISNTTLGFTWIKEIV